MLLRGPLTRLRPHPQAWLWHSKNGRCAWDPASTAWLQALYECIAASSHTHEQHTEHLGRRRTSHTETTAVGPERSATPAASSCQHPGHNRAPAQACTCCTYGTSKSLPYHALKPLSNMQHTQTCSAVCSAAMSAPNPLNRPATWRCTDIHHGTPVHLSSHARTRQGAAGKHVQLPSSEAAQSTNRACLV